jgi:hypothetical protein
MPQVIHSLNDPVITIADTEAGLTAGDEIHCQMSAATLTTSANEKDVPQTGCYPPTKLIGDPSYALELAWLQDWSDPSGVSRFAQEFNGQRKWVSFLLDEADATTVVTGEVTVAAGQYGGTFGDLAVASASWPFAGQPTFPAYTAPAAELADAG